MEIKPFSALTLYIIVNLKHFTKMFLFCFKLKDYPIKKVELVKLLAYFYN